MTADRDRLALMLAVSAGLHDHRSWLGLMRVDQRDHAVFVDHEHAVRSRFDDQAHLLFGKFLFAIIHIHGARADNLTRVVRHRVAAQQHGNGPAVANEKLALTGNDFALHRVSIAVCAE